MLIGRHLSRRELLGGAAIAAAGIDPVLGRADPSATRAAAGAPGLTDLIDVSAPGSEHAHNVAEKGFASSIRYSVRAGGHVIDRLVRQLNRPGDGVSYRVRVRPNAPVTLEIEELDVLGWNVSGYQLLIDNRPVYFRTWQGCGTGPVHYFVQEPASTQPFITLTLINRTWEPVRISRIWVWSDLQALSSQFEVPFYIAPTLPLAWTLQPDLANLALIKNSLGDHPHARPAFTTWIAYADLCDRELEAKIDYVLTLAEKAGLPVQLCFDTWWASTPVGSDGRGGSWMDVEHQQVVYDATTRRYQLSIPNQWSSTPWLTVSDPSLNAFKQERLSAAASLLKKRMMELTSEGKRNLLLAVNLDNEPIYWASGNAGIGGDLLQADFNPHVVAAAKRDGINLDPEKALGPVERHWLLRNLLRYNEGIADAISSALGRDASIVNRSGSRASFDLIANNVYTQAMMMASPEYSYPTLDRSYPLWESAAPASARVGGEWLGESLGVVQAVQRQIALGRNAAVNAECGLDANENSSVRPAYALGQRYIAPYNYPLERMDLASKHIRDVSAQWPAFVHERTLFEERFRPGAWFDKGWKGHAHAWGGLQDALIGNTAIVAVAPVASDVVGFLTYRIQAPAGGFRCGLRLELTGRAFVFKREDPRVCITVLAGASDDPSKMAVVAVLHDNGAIDPTNKIDLSAHVHESRPLFVRLELRAPDLPPGLLSWCALYRVRFTQGWPADYTRAIPRQEESVKTVRAQNLVVSWRRDAELAIEQLAARIPHQRGNRYADRSKSPEERLAAARAHYARGLYADAYRAANEGLCVCLPAAYLVDGSARLDPYPVRVDCRSRLQCTLYHCGANQTRIRLETAKPANATVCIDGVKPGEGYMAYRYGSLWVISCGRVREEIPEVDFAEGGHLISGTAAPDGTADPSGALEVTAPAEGPALIEGAALGAFGAPLRGIRVRRTFGPGAELIPIESTTVIRRGETGKPHSPATLADLQFGDQIEARMDPAGTCREVSITYGIVESVVREFRQTTPYAMPHIVTDPDGAFRVIDLAAPIHTPRFNVRVAEVPLGAIDVAAGDRVRIRFNPSTGRVYELWKLN
jgi:hypothetical protein